MELVELHVGEFGTGLRGQCDAITGGHRWIGCVAIDLPRTAGGNQNCTHENTMRNMVSIQQISSDDSPATRHKTSDARPFQEPDVLVFTGIGDQRPADLRARCIPVGVQNAWKRMRAFTRAFQSLAVLRSKQVPHSINSLTRNGPSCTSALKGRPRCDSLRPSPALTVSSRCSANIFGAIHCHSDGALRVMRIRFGDLFFCDYQDLTLFCEFYCGPKPCNTRPHDQKICTRQIHTAITI